MKRYLAAGDDLNLQMRMIIICSLGIFELLVLRMIRNKGYSMNMQRPKVHETEQDRAFVTDEMGEEFLRSTDYPELATLGVVAYCEVPVSEAAIAVQSLGTMDWTPTVDVIECAFLQSLGSGTLLEDFDEFGRQRLCITQKGLGRLTHLLCRPLQTSLGGLATDGMILKIYFLGLLVGAARKVVLNDLEECCRRDIRQIQAKLTHKSPSTGWSSQSLNRELRRLKQDISWVYRLKDDMAH